jgi:tetratricopeptide (TPR) repeat protein
MTWFARGLGFARAKDPAGAAAAVEELQKLSDRLAQAGEKYWAEQVAIQRLGVEAWRAFAEGRTDEALATMRSAAAREDATEKSAITPGPLAPARELLGELLLQLKQPKDALAEFEATLTKEPNRFRALSGAATAALQCADRARARKYAQQLVKICPHADTPARAELAAARRLLAPAK